MHEVYGYVQVVGDSFGMPGVGSDDAAELFGIYEPFSCLQVSFTLHGLVAFLVSVFVQSVG